MVVNFTKFLSDKILLKIYSSMDHEGVGMAYKITHPKQASIFPGNDGAIFVKPKKALLKCF